MEAMEKVIAKDLLKIQAVFFRPDEPFTWASGIKSPVYTDNRLTLTAPEVRLDVDMCNVHASGTSAMMKAALEGLTRPDGSRPLLIAVTQLTSTDEDSMRRELLIDRPLDQVVMSYASTAKEAGLDGVVCSPLEAGKVHQTCGDGFVTVTPGVRFADGDVGDQKRVTTPEKARELGSDYIVVGRPITAAADPVAAYERCVKEFVG